MSSVKTWRKSYALIFLLLMEETCNSCFEVALNFSFNRIC